LNLDNGFYVFPPNPEGLVKVAIHGAGYTHKTSVGNASDGGVSVPRTKLTKGAEDGAIPKEMVDDLRRGLRDIFPELAGKDFEGTRLCWYVAFSFSWNWS
jgi:sarcosine oxidase/L-pipecolate oxidase